MSRATSFALGCAASLIAFTLLGVLIGGAYESAWIRDCDKLGATVVDDVAYTCARKNPTGGRADG